MHVQILGQTLTGKTTLSKKLASGYRRAGVGVIVLDPIGDPEWDCDFRTSDFDKFMDVYRNSRQCAAFFDEAGDLCNAQPYLMTRTATRGRHRGHRNHYIAQRGVLILRTIRDQCSQIFLFNSGLEDCKIHAAEWNAPELREKGPFLERGEYYHKQRMGNLTRGRIF